jgi:hypothetical protein
MGLVSPTLIAPMLVRYPFKKKWWSDIAVTFIRNSSPHSKPHTQSYIAYGLATGKLSKSCYEVP